MSETYFDIIPKELIFFIASKIYIQTSNKNIFEENISNDLRNLLNDNRNFLSMRYFRDKDIHVTNLGYFIYFSIPYNFDYLNPGRRISSDNILKVEEIINRYFSNKVYKENNGYVIFFSVLISFNNMGTGRIGLLIRTKQIFELYPALIPLDLNYLIMSKIKSWYEIKRYAEAFDIVLDDKVYRFLIKSVYPTIYKIATELKIHHNLEKEDYESLDDLYSDSEESDSEGSEIDVVDNIFKGSIEILMNRNTTPNLAKIILRSLYPKAYKTINGDELMRNNIVPTYHDVLGTYEWGHGGQYYNWAKELVERKLTDDKLPIKVSVQQLDSFDVAFISEDISYWVLLLNLDIEHILKLPRGKDTLDRLLDKLLLLNTESYKFILSERRFNIPEDYSFHKNFLEYISKWNKR